MASGVWEVSVGSEKREGKVGCEMWRVWKARARLRSDECGVWSCSEGVRNECLILKRAKYGVEWR